MAIYDINGNVVTSSGSVSSDDIKTALIGAVADGTVNLGSSIGATLSYTSPGTDWETYAETAYNNLLEAYRSIPNSGIPFFISTDQHGKNVEQHRWLNNADTDGMNILNINLGDTVTDTFNTDVLNNILSRTWQIKNFIAVTGNHEKHHTTGEIPNDYTINRTFISTMNKIVNVGPLNCYSIIDGLHNVKIIVVDTNVLDESGNLSQGLTTAVADWILEEIGQDNRRDILWLNHWPLFTTCRQRADTSEVASNTVSGITDVQFAIWQMLLDRKNKVSGTYTDANGVSHVYDFTGCKGNLLCCFHGHIHEEWFTMEDGLTAYAADWYSNDNACTFGLIDRINSKVTFWVFDSTGCRDPLELPI